jgi:hypothetical protein
MGTFVPFFMMASMASLSPTPVSRQMTASLIYGIKMRFARNPGESALTEGTFPIALQNSTAIATVAALVCKPEMISTPFCTGTGFMKWVDTTRELADVSVGSFVVDAAILVMEIEDVLVARMAWVGHICASLAKMSNFRSGISGTASITKSTSDRSSSFVVDESRDRASSAWSCVIRDLDTSLARSLSESDVSHGSGYLPPLDLG